MAEPGGVLVVIPCLNEEAHIDGLLAQLAQDPGCADALIVVADGGSTDGTRPIVERWASRDQRIRLMDNPARIQSAGVNAAVRAFGKNRTILVRIDAHCGYPDGYVSGLIGTLGRTGAQSVVVPMVTEGRGCFQRAVAAAQNSRLGAGGAAHRIGGESGWIDHGHHAAFDLAAYCAAGGYDETFSHNEDAELDVRLAAQGGRIWFAGELPIVYFPRSRPWPLFRQYLAYGRGRAMTARRHGQRLKLRQLLPLAVAPAVIALVAAPFFWPLALPTMFWSAVCIGYGLVLAAKAGDACVAASGLAAMVMHLGWSLGFLRQRLFGAAPGPAPSAIVRP